VTDYDASCDFESDFAESDDVMCYDFLNVIGYT